MTDPQLTAHEYRDLSYQTIKNKFAMFFVGMVVVFLLLISISKILPFAILENFHLSTPYIPTSSINIKSLTQPKSNSDKALVESTKQKQLITEDGQISAIMSERVTNTQTEYIVKEGDSLASIAQVVYGDINAWLVIANANNLASPDLIEVGMELVIPR
ncbi:hypothetical protein A3F03_05120 [Candidatus Roizmanbacteria bacterium RIFCSPHIGHO2_12_FULL_41_11]|uniref:LysM domain-containing protein n=2 Tax=Candidatus Roizmaniibacteriota TaxID=1752723 RepID=A0A1F7JRJ2_9BACT|nr:MAG: hypothetical protein A3F03_05120 [Candidatus Roizmanbacteria bacterium RIFCSPHIGHO2_12_FULL_41_11]OGK58213.1 MAG: hypothetical protein A3H86_02850 [Candidatus Roizmanbacteria bacterium RIFCSPLOWO2_02_FULL_41_9]